MRPVGFTKEQIKRLYKHGNYGNIVKDFNYNNPDKNYAWDPKHKVYVAKPKRRLRDKKFKNPNVSTLHTIKYYGTKKLWVEEYRLVFKYLHTNYGVNTLIDVFGGSGIISLLGSSLKLFNKIVYNDIFYMLVMYHSVLKDPEHFKKFIHYIDYYSRVDWEFLKSKLEELKKEVDSYSGKVRVRGIHPEKAALYYILKHHQFQGQGAVVKGKKPASDYLATLKRTHSLYENIEITSYTYKKVINKYLNDENCLIFLDPPYVETTRVQGKSYSSEFTYENHRRLLETLTQNTVKAKVILCGYDNLQYKHKLNAGSGWQCIEFNNSGLQGHPKECIWVNFDFSTLLTERKKPTITEIKEKTVKPYEERLLLFNIKY